jgi:hypothetical protein
MRYIALDGSRIGLQIELLMMDNNHKKLIEFSREIQNGIDAASDFVDSRGVTVIKGGDNLIGFGDFHESDATEVKRLFQHYAGAEAHCVVAKSLSEALRMMKLAKVK